MGRDEQFARLLLLAVSAGLIGVIGIMLLAIARMVRKHLYLKFRAQEQAMRGPTSNLDPWELSGRRLTGDAPPPGLGTLADDLITDDDIFDPDDRSDPLVDDDEHDDDDDEDDSDLDEDDPDLGKFPFR